MQPTESLEAGFAANQLQHQQALNALKLQLATPTKLRVRGWVAKVSGTMIKAVVPGVKIAELCHLITPDTPLLIAEVVGFDQHFALLSPMGDIQGISNQTEVVPTGHSHQVQVGSHLLGQVVDALGHSLADGATLADGASFTQGTAVDVTAPAPNAMQRPSISEPLSLGVKAIDGLLSCGKGQRLGIFSAAGGGKSTLLAMLMRNADVDVIVLALIGERGREVREFIERDLGPQGLEKAVVVVATSDRPAMERAKAPLVATAIAEYFRDLGKNVLLLMDSVTRYARALREIGLAAGEPPTRRGYPPSVFAALPQLMERAGQAPQGSITALYTVLVEGDDLSEPIADETRSILDGHIVLSSELAAQAHYPAIDILKSASRVMQAFSSASHQSAAHQVRKWLAKYQEVSLLLQIGEYQAGQDPETDTAVENISHIRSFLQQDTHFQQHFSHSVQQLEALSS